MADHPADPVAEACGQLAAYVPILERLVAEPSAEGPAPGFTGRASAAPPPGNAEALYALTDIWEGVPRLEAVLRYLVTGHPGARRGGSAGNIRAAFAAIPKLAAGLPDDAGGSAVRYLDKLANEARVVRAIDEARRWRPLPRQDHGQGLPPRCPYCECFQLQADMDARPVVIACFVPGCADGSGLCPVATMGTDESGRPVLMWADGRTETAPDLEEARDG